MELAKRAGYFGTIGGASDIVASTSEQGTLSDSLGITEEKNVSELEGSERASETLKNKIKIWSRGCCCRWSYSITSNCINLRC
jgi:hypothetical protein